MQQQQRLLQHQQSLESHGMAHAGNLKLNHRMTPVLTLIKLLLQQLLNGITHDMAQYGTTLMLWLDLVI
jgi:hypothetical protein